MELESYLVKQSKSKTQITRSVHYKFNCITLKYNGTQHGIYIIYAIPSTFYPISVSFLLI